MNKLLLEETVKVCQYLEDQGIDTRSMDYLDIYVISNNQTGHISYETN